MIDEETQYNVKVENAFKSYGKNPVIKGLNMNVTSGSIYGLLGPSGCGKTTLLRCILGSMSLDSGYINLKANYLNDIGYMPQDMCLEETLTVKEIFEFYGNLYNMSNNEIDRRIHEINKFLHLPNLNNFIGKISGGQIRRVSLGISIFHDPKIIILDEPTVGIDPLLREQVWKEFTNMTKQHNKTIIVTTHYIEEARLADCIGLMRKGVLVEEGSPQNILAKYDTNSLEESFVIACCGQETNEVPITQINYHTVQEESKKVESNQLTRFYNNFSYHRINTLLKKNILVCSRDYVFLYTTVILPILLSIIFCFGIGVNIKNMIITIKNEEVNISDCQNLNNNGCIFDNNNNYTMSCVVLNYLQAQDYKFVEVKDQEIGEMSINIPNNLAFLYFQKNFTKELTIYIDDREMYANLSYAHITKENNIFRNQIKMDILDSINYLLEKILKACSYSPKVSRIPIEINRIFGQEVESYSHSANTLFLSLLIFYMSSIFSCSFMMAEKMDGTLSRSMFAGVKVLELVLSMFCMNTIIIIIQMFFLLVNSYLFFSYPIEITNGLIMYVILMFTIGWMGFLFGLIFAVLTPTKIGGVYLVIAMTLGQFYLAGVIWPIDGQHVVIRKLSDLLPVRLVGYTMNEIALKGWTLDHPLLIARTTTLFIYTMVLVFILFVLGKLKKDLWVIHK